MFEKLKQIKDLRDQAKKLQDALSTVSAQGSAAWGKVSVTVNGTQQVTGVSIDPSLLTADNKASLESAIKDACNDAAKKVQVLAMEKMKETGGLPGLDGLTGAGGQS
jgi:DNA-binding YbaB/EbfC family protein